MQKTTAALTNTNTLQGQYNDKESLKKNVDNDIDEHWTVYYTLIWVVLCHYCVLQKCTFSCFTWIDLIGH